MVRNYVYNPKSKAYATLDKLSFSNTRSGLKMKITASGDAIDILSDTPFEHLIFYKDDPDARAIRLLEVGECRVGIKEKDDERWYDVRVEETSIADVPEPLR